MATDPNPLDQPENDPLDGWRTYVATNLLAFLEAHPEYNNGDWYGALMWWAKAHASDKYPPNPVHRPAE